ncbi:hypothetical protein [Terrisporobacter vanillatitrophus]|uniref:hypothetical protein n=1 Tax=Terrisporobacter vanillatitrophus TaxID=3058402 RepID=UPI003366E130
MSNWILDHVIDSIKSKIVAKEEFIKVCELERNKFQAWPDTEDTYEVKNNEYWRVAKAMAEVQLKEYRDELREINDMLQEDSKQYDILYDVVNDNIPCVGVI